jgi:hypothetical protein
MVVGEGREGRCGMKGRERDGKNKGSLPHASPLLTVALSPPSLAVQRQAVPGQVTYGYQVRNNKK